MRKMLIIENSFMVNDLIGFFKRQMRKMLIIENSFITINEYT
jgi:hypothetical protein